MEPSIGLTRQNSGRLDLIQIGLHQYLIGDYFIDQVFNSYDFVEFLLFSELQFKESRNFTYLRLTHFYEEINIIQSSQLLIMPINNKLIFAIFILSSSSNSFSYIIYMADIPRKPTFPDHIIRKIVTRIEREVEDQVIPVSTGIYTEQKLIQKLSAIPKPILQDYDDLEKIGICNVDNCSGCGTEFSNKIKSIMCHFCSKWRCDQCTSVRQRLHPLDSNPNGPRYSICNDCDNKFLLLQLNHPYVENKILIEEAIMAVNKELQEIEESVEIIERRNNEKLAEPRRKMGIKQSILKKQQLEISKKIKKNEENIQSEQQKHQKLIEKKKQAIQKAEAYKKYAIRKQIEKQERQKQEKEQKMRREELERIKIQQQKQQQKQKIQSSPSESSQDEKLSQDRKENTNEEPTNTYMEDQRKSDEKQDEYWRENTEQQLKQFKMKNQQNHNSSQLPSTFGEGITQDQIKYGNQQPSMNQISDKNSQQQNIPRLPSQMMDYFTEPEYSNEKNRISLENEQKMMDFKRSLEQPEEDYNTIQNAKKQLLRQAIMRQKQWENDEDNNNYVDKGGKCKCAMF